VIHTYSGYEKKVKANLEHRIESMGMEDKIFQVLVPEEDEIEIRGRAAGHVQKKVYPGYVLVEMILDPDSWFVVRNTPGVTSFVGGGNIPGTRNEPIPLDEAEVKQILRQMGVETPKYRVAFQKGQSVRVTDGPVLRVHRHGRRGQPRAQQAQGPRQHLRPRERRSSSTSSGREALASTTRVGRHGGGPGRPAAAPQCRCEGRRKTTWPRRSGP
jgi:transcriptional antiterminator NusG